jgi:hypothetical protein
VISMLERRASSSSCWIVSADARRRSIKNKYLIYSRSSQIMRIIARLPGSKTRIILLHARLFDHILTFDHKFHGAKPACAGFVKFAVDYSRQIPQFSHTEMKETSV